MILCKLIFFFLDTHQKKRLPKICENEKKRKTEKLSVFLNGHVRSIGRIEIVAAGCGGIG